MSLSPKPRWELSARGEQGREQTHLGVLVEPAVPRLSLCLHDHACAQDQGNEQDGVPQLLEILLQGGHTPHKKYGPITYNSSRSGEKGSSPRWHQTVVYYKGWWTAPGTRSTNAIFTAPDVFHGHLVDNTEDRTLD